MDKQIIIYLLYALIIIIVGVLIRTIFSIFIVSNNSELESQRLKELKAQENKKTDEEKEAQIRQVVEKITDPVIEKVLRGKPPKNYIKLQRKLKIAGYDKYFSPIQWSALTIVLGAIGVVLFLAMYSQSSMFAFVLLAVFAIMPSFLLTNSYNNHTDAIVMAFPETIKIMSGYLSAGKILPDAVTETAKNASPAWVPLLNGFRTKCDTVGILEALDWFKGEVDIMEAREFFATVRLTLELGGSAKKGFSDQADKIQKLLRDTMQKRIEKRKIWATAVQAPIFLCIIGAFALPVIGTFIDLF